MVIKPAIYYSLAVAGLAAGLAYYAWQRGWLIIQCPAFGRVCSTTQQSPSCKGTVMLYAWTAHQWKKEKVDLVLPVQQDARAQVIIQALLAWFADEKWLSKKITVEHVLTTGNGQELLVCFDKVLFSKTMSMHHKVTIIESIVKTLRENGIKVPYLRFLVEHQPMLDAHLDFSHGWPLEGYSAN